MNKYLKKAENGSGIDHYTRVPGTGAKQKITFTKMHGCANDYVYIDCFQNDIQNYAELAIYLSDRHTGIGGDGVIYIPSRPSHIGNAIQNISRMLDELEKVNFIQLADKLNETLDNMSEILNRGELKSTLNNINQICSNLETSSRRLQAALSEENVQKVNRAIDNLDAGILSLRKFGDSPELGTMVRSLNTFLTDASAAIKKAEAGGAKLSDDAAALKLRLEMTLTRLDNSLRQLQEFTQNVENDPNQFVKGRQEKPVLP